MDIEKLFRNIDICNEALSFAQKLQGTGQVHEVEGLLQDLSLLTNTILQQLRKEKEKDLERALLCGMNIEASFERFFHFPLQRESILKFEIPAHFYELRYLLHFGYEVIRDPEKIREYREKIFKDIRNLRKNPVKKKYKYKASIFLRGYNKLEYTKMAVESLFKYTDFSNGDIELITLNNGSTDGTEAYFDSLPHEKKLNRKYNMLGVPFAPFICEGEYLVPFSNDVVATPRWLEQLLLCMDSSDDIFWAVPTCNVESISFGQGISVPYSNIFSDIEKIEEFSNKYNRSQPDLWEERSALMPFVSIIPSYLLYYPTVDPSYTKSQFNDDDVSTLFRRAGWRMVLAKDTFLHHFGSITFGDSKIVSNRDALDEMRKVYFDKWGVDAWESRGILGIENIFQWISPQKESRILWIEPKFGTDFLSMKNFYRKNGCGDVKADAMVVDSRYLPDAKYYFDRCIPAENLLQAVSEVQEGYDLIGMSACLHEVVDGSAVALLEKLYGILNPGGLVLVPVKNWNSASCLKEIITSGGVHPWNCPANTFKGLSMWGLLEELAQHKCLKNYSRLVLAEPDAKLCKDMHSKLAKMFSDVYDSEDFKTILQINMMWLGFQKN